MGIITELLSGSERRDHPSNPRDWLWGLSGGIDTYTGKKIDEHEALHSTAFFAAIKFIAETIASLPLHLYRRMSPKGKERASAHPLYNMLHLRPNPEMTSMNYREAMIGQCVTWGDCFSEKDIDGSGNVKALWPLQSSKMTVRRINDVLLYEYRLPEGKLAILPRERVLHVPAFGGNGLAGYNIVDKGREAIGISLALEEFAARFFSNNAKPPAVLEHPGVMGEDGVSNFRKSWHEAQGGLSNSNRIAILEEGMKLHEYGVSPEQAQAIQSRKFSVTEIARLTNLPPHILKDLDRASFNNIEQMSLELVVYSLRPWMVRFEQNYTTQLLSEKEQKKYFVEHLIDGLLRGDTVQRWTAYTQGFNIGALSPNDILEMENKNPYEGGDQHFVQLNMVPVDEAGDYAQEKIRPAVTEEKSIRSAVRARSGKERMRLRNAYYRLFADAGQRVVNKETKAVKQAIKKHIGERDNVTFERWLESFYKDMPQYVKTIFAPIIRTYAEAIQAAAANEVGAEVGITPDMEQFIEEYLDSYSERHIQSSLEQLKSLIESTKLEELGTALEGRTDEWASNRADKVAQRETVRADGAFTRFALAVAGIVHLRWVAHGSSSCPWCRSLDGKIVGIQEPFIEPGNLMADGQSMTVYGPKLHPQLHDGCQCQIVAG